MIIFQYQSSAEFVLRPCLSGSGNIEYGATCVESNDAAQSNCLFVASKDHFSFFSSLVIDESFEHI